MACVFTRSTNGATANPSASFKSTRASLTPKCRVGRQLRAPFVLDPNEFFARLYGGAKRLAP